MSAKEMFEKLGYELVNEAPLLYQFNDGGFIKNIEFSISLKSITFSGYEYYNDGRPTDENRIYVDELQAINKQIEELGWNNELNKRDLESKGEQNGL